MRAPLRAVWDEPRPPDVPARVWRDGGLLALLVPAAVLEGVLRPDLDGRVLQIVAVTVLALLLPWRRTRPLLVIVLALGVSVPVQLVLGGPVELTAVAAMILLPCALARWGSGREVLLGSVLLFGSAAWSVTFRDVGPAGAVAGLAILSAALAAGAALRYRERERARTLEKVKLEEREQLARDLHDTVAHHVSAMAIRAQAGLATAATRPEAAADALRVIEEEAVRALVEMRAMVRVLRRDEPAELAPGPRLADLTLLAGRAGPGPAVDVEVTGDVDGVPPPVAAAAFRLAQESITNARRHARHASRIEVRATADEQAVHLRVTDDGEAGPARGATRPGYGLTGMAERAGLLGGTCEAGPLPGPDRGWAVTAVLPRERWAS